MTRNSANVTLATNGMLVGVGRDALSCFQVPYPECLFGCALCCLVLELGQ